jgi:hypothetical protein
MKPFSLFCLSVALLFSWAGDCRAKVLFFIGEDKPSIDHYVKATGLIPAGTMVYTAIQDPGSLQGPVDNGGGIQDGQYLLDKYPHSAIQVGLWMNGALDDIPKGKYDQNIDTIGDWIKKANRPVYLRIGYEFDLPANDYEPRAYREAFRYIVRRLRKENVRNAYYVWHSYANLGTHPWKEWYPGDDYVDWFAISVFERPNIYMKKFAEMARQHHKELMIAESTPQGYGMVYGKNFWKLWFEPFFQFINDEKVRIVCYIDYDWESILMFKGQGWKDARVQSNEYVKTKWMQEIQKDKYNN